MLGLFILSAVLQVNDPDPLIWIAVYLLAALYCFLYWWRRLRPYAAGFLSAGSLAWSAATLPLVAWDSPLWNSEEGRELMGLVLIFLWMGVLALKKPLDSKQ